MPATLTPPKGSHKTSVSNGKVTIHRLELFVGFDPRIDSEDDKKIKNIDRARIKEIVARTHVFGERGQNPKLILEHNSMDPDKPGSPIIGDIPFKTVRVVDIDGVPGIVGDVVMSTADFSEYIQSNRYPRRSAEIWKDGLLSEVAVLAGKTPARPLPDTQFAKGGVIRFQRDLPALDFDKTTGLYTDPGPRSVRPPSARKRKMADDRTPEEELDDLKNNNRDLEDEVKSLKMSLAKFEDDMDGKERNLRDASVESDRHTREMQTMHARLTRIDKELLREQYGRRLDEMQASGYRVGGPERQTEILDEIVGAGRDGAEKKFQFCKSFIQQDPVGASSVIDQRGVRVASAGQREQFDKEKAAGEAALAKCSAEGKHDTEFFKTCYQEFLATGAA